jgi:predicted RND superfamily exporter protein
MNNDQYQDKYTEVFKDLKEEKMNWDFEDFLQKADNSASDEADIIPISKAKPSFPKWFWMAASIILLVSAGFIFNLDQNGNVEDQAQLVENEIQKQKSDFIKENHEHQTQVAVLSSDSISGEKKDSIFQEVSLAEVDVLDKILSKKSRIKKETKPRYVNNTGVQNIKDSTGYRDSYVIVNGKRIDNVEEAINVTKYSFQVVANNMNQALAQPKVMDNVEY